MPALLKFTKIEVIIMGLYLGLDSSTQGLKGIIIDADSGNIITSESVNFGKDLPEYKCSDGALENSNPLIKHSDPLMWVAALDMVLEKFQKAKAPLADIIGISGCGQQHGSVYLNDTFTEVLKNLNSDKNLVEQVKGSLARKSSPIWMDGSTEVECREISEVIPDLQERTGSPAIERFTGAQIRKFWKEESANYANTEHIALVSSFLCSLLCGEVAPVDYGDASGMNLLNIKTLQWDSEVAGATAPDLLSKLPSVVSTDSVVGSLSPYFLKYGFSDSVLVSVWTGDNPASLIGAGGWKSGIGVISLGTSDTFFAAMDRPVTDPNGYGHVFGNPASGFMSLICFTNGSLAREAIKEESNLSWDEFDVTSFEETEAGNGGNMMLPYFVPETTPLVNKKIVKYLKDPKSSYEKVRVIIESQILSMKLHSEWLNTDFDTIRITGGGSKSAGITQVIADIFQANVEKISIPDSATLGTAMMAAHSIGGYQWSDLSDKFTKPYEVITPNRDNKNIYDKMLVEFKNFLDSNI